jgi:hypothetical protein
MPPIREYTIRVKVGSVEKATPNITLEGWEAEQMQDPKFRAEVRRLWPSYQVTRLWFKLRRVLAWPLMRECGKCAGTGVVPFDEGPAMGWCPDCEGRMPGLVWRWRRREKCWAGDRGI